MKLNKAAVITAVVLILFSASSISMAADDPFRLQLKEGESIAFTGIGFSTDADKKLLLDLDWTGLGMVLDIYGVNARLGMAVDFWKMGETPASFGITGGLGLDWTKIISLLAVVDASGNAFIQKNAAGVSGALTARVSANTAKLAIVLDAGAMWPGFDKFPAMMLGQSAWTGKAQVMDPGQGWLELALAFMSSKDRKDSINLTYSRDIEDSLNRFDIGYSTSFSPDDSGFTLGLYTSIGFGQIIPILTSEFSAEYDITDDIGIMAALGAQGGLYPMAWFRGKAWAEINEAAIVELEGKTPIIILDPLASRLYLEDLSRYISLGVTFPEALMSKVLLSYDFNRDVFSIGYSLKF